MYVTFKKEEEKRIYEFIFLFLHKKTPKDNLGGTNEIGYFENGGKIKKNKWNFSLESYVVLTYVT